MERVAATTELEPALRLVRRPRGKSTAKGLSPEVSWAQATSWLGGLPRLGEVPWPRNSKGVPLLFVAQLDLADAAAALGLQTEALPGGSLAFFLDGWSKDGLGLVRQVPTEAARTGHTPVPQDAPAAYSCRGELFPQDANPMAYAEAPRTFPYWPVAMLPESQVHLVAGRPYFLSARELRTRCSTPLPYYWHTALHLAQCLRVCVATVPNRMHYEQKRWQQAKANQNQRRPEGHWGAGKGWWEAWWQKWWRGPSPEAKRAAEQTQAAWQRWQEMQGQVASFAAFVQEVTDWTQDRAPWSVMPENAVAQLEAKLATTHREYRRLSSIYCPRTLAELETHTFVEMATAEADAYRTFPAELVALLETGYQVPTGAQHQLFGEPAVIQGNAMEEQAGKLLLLQLGYDDMLHWQFGDMGAYQFWIAPEDFRAGRWAAAEATFEGH